MKPAERTLDEPLDLNLRPGETLQLQFMDDPAQGPFFVKVIGYVADRSLLVSTPEKAGAALEGRAAIVRMFAGDQAQGFSCMVLRACTQPYAYLHLSYPRKMDPARIRKSSRVRTALAVGVRPAGTEGGAEVPAVIRDISVTGAQLLAAAPVGNAGARVVVRARLPIETLGDQAVDLPALIRNVQEDALVKGSLWRYRCGIEFAPLDAQSTLVLRAYLYERGAP
jgi:hypothetical protein